MLSCKNTSQRFHLATNKIEEEPKIIGSDSHSVKTPVKLGLPMSSYPMRESCTDFVVTKKLGEKKSDINTLFLIL